MPLNLDNTEIAFRSRSGRELLRSYWLFRLMSHPWVVRLGTSLVGILLWLKLPIEWLIEKTIFRQFCGGQTIEDCQKTIDNLSRFHVGTILDYSVEGSGSETVFDETAREIERTIWLAHSNPKIPFCVFKVSGIARFDLLVKINQQETLREVERLEWERIKARILGICQTAHDRNVRVFIDAEESWIQDAVDSLAEDMMAQFNRDFPIVYTTVQMYRTDRTEYLDKLFQRAKTQNFLLGIKLVRGAYMEKERERSAYLGLPSPILPDKLSTDRNYDSALQWCVSRLDKVSLCAGTHNEASVRLLATMMARSAISSPDPRIFFSQLFGMSDHLSYNLANDGYNVAKYVPYGPIRAVIPYLFRRAEENTSIQGQTNRELDLIKQEIQRRKQFP